MADQLSELLMNLLEDTDQTKLKQAFPRLVQLLSREQGQQLVKKIKQTDPKKLSELLGQIDKAAAAGKMERADMILKQAEQNPEFLRDLTKLL